jgi:hypothetical protein
MKVNVTDGSVVIRWPAPRDGVMSGWQVEVLDAESGEQMLNVVRGRVVLCLDPDNVVRVELEQYTGPGDEPVTSPLFDDEGEPVTAMFRYQVARMETSEG